MRNITKIISLGITIITIVLACTYLGYRYGNIAIGIIVGFVLAIMYLMKEVFKHD